MARRYVRDKAGRFASKGGGGKRSGKLSKSTAGRSAKATYKSKTSAVRKAERATSAPRKAYQAATANQGRGAKGSYASRQKAKKRSFNKLYKAESAVRGKKSAVTRYTKKATAGRKAAGSGIKKGLSAQAALRRRMTFSSKTTKGRRAKAEWKKARGADRKGPLGEGRGQDRNQKRVIKKQTGKTAYSQGYRETPAKTKAPRAGSRTKSQKRRDKIESKKSLNESLRGNKFKGPKKRVTKKAAAAAKRAKLHKREAEFRKKDKAARKGGLKPKPGETAKQFKGRLKRGAKSAHARRALSKEFSPEGRGSYYKNMRTEKARSKRRETAKSRRRAESRDTWGDGTGGNRRSRAITKSKERHAYKMKKRRERERRRSRRR
tara:strand:- start:213 stop:1343 length:1131 start_codon:yes stop_codon:yes gene_type:complete